MNRYSLRRVVHVSLLSLSLLTPCVFAEVPAEWATKTNSQLVDLYDASRTDAATLAQVGDYIESKFMTARSGDSFAMSDWIMVVARAQPHLSAEGKTQLRQAIDAELGKAQPFGGDRTKLVQAADVLIRMGDQAAARAVYKKLADAEGNGFAAMSPRELARTADSLTGEKALDQARQELAAHVMGTYFVNSDKVREIAPEYWAILAKTLQGDVSGQSRENWAEQLYSAFAASESAVAALTPSKASGLMSALDALGDQERSTGVALTWVLKSSQLQNADKSALAGIVQYMDTDDPMGFVARNKLFEKFMNEVEASPKKVDSIRKWDLMRMVRGCSQDLTEPQKKQYATLIKTILLGDPQALAGLNEGVRWTYVDYLAKLDQTAAATLMTGYLRAEGKSVNDLSPNRRLKLLGLLIDSESDLGQQDKAMLTELKALVNETYDPTNISGWEESRIASKYMKQGELGEARVWIKRLYDRLVAAETLDVNRVGAIADLMESASMLNKGQRYPELAAHIVALAKAGKFYTDDGGKLSGKGWKRRHIAYAINVKADRDLLEAELLDADGIVRIEVAHLLAWAYWRAGELDQWASKVNTMLGEVPGDEPDKKAALLIARGQVEFLKINRQNPLGAKARVDEAFGIAVSESMRLQVLKQYAWMYQARGLHSQLASQLMGLRHQFQEEGNLQSIDRMVAIAQGLAYQTTSDLEISRNIAYQRMVRAKMAQVENAIKTAQQAEDAEQVTALEQELQLLVQQLASLEQALMEQPSQP